LLKRLRLVKEGNRGPFNPSFQDSSMMGKEYPEEFLKKLRAVTAKRPKTVIDHILKHGHITTEELKEKYGYNHPPRAARDVREHGIPLEMFKVTGGDGRQIAAYRFGDPSEVRGATLAGRKVFSKLFKKPLVDRDGEQCAICSTEYDERYLQVDHCIPYEVAGDPPGDPKPEDHMLLCGSCNRAKSWSCEHCPNWIKDKKPAVCETCYWASPTDYTHVATLQIRRLDLTGTGKETAEFDKLAKASRKLKIELPEFVKQILRKNL
jgi:HNH endonuclease